MSSKLYGGDDDTRQQVKFRADGELVARFDVLVEQSEEYDNRADALRASMRRLLGSADEHSAPRAPPVNDQLRQAYLALVSLSNYQGIVPHDIATSELSTHFGRSQKLVERRILAKLRNRGYLQHLTNVNGTDRAWKVRGIDDA